MKIPFLGGIHFNPAILMWTTGVLLVLIHPTDVDGLCIAKERRKSPRGGHGMASQDLEKFFIDAAGKIHNFLLVFSMFFLVFHHESLIFWGSITPFAWFYPIIFSKRQNFCFLDLVMHVSGCTRTKERPIFDREYCTPFWSFLTLALGDFFLVNLHARTTVEHSPI